MATTFRLSAALLCALLSVALAREALAQNDVVVTTTVKPPYSPYLSDYVGFDNKIVVTLRNTTNGPLNVRLVGQVKGSSGVTVTIPNSFVPTAPIALAANQTRMLAGTQLKEYFDPDNLQFSGISKAEVIQGNGLPEGDYSLCLRALDYVGATPRSQAAPSGCANFTITHYEPPMLTAPACNGTVAPKEPQSVLFAWTIPAGAPPAKMEYALKIVEMIPADANPAQAMASATDPPFFQTTVPGTSFQYGPAQPKLIPGKRYAVRVTARNKGVSKELNFKNGGNSVVCAFTYGAGEGGGKKDDGPKDDGPNDGEGDQVDVDENYANPCTALNCAPQPPPAATPSDKAYQVGDEVKIGYFTLKLTSLTSAAAGNLSGEGEIDAPIFHTKLRATFNGLKVNPQHKVYSGKAIGAYDPGAQVDAALRSFANNVDDVVAAKVKDLADYVQAKGKYVENFADVNATGLPFAWKKMVNSKLQLVSIAAVEFAPDGARFNAFLEMPIPEANNALLAFAQKNVCFHPTGLSVDGLQKMTMLGQDRTFAWGNHIDVTLKAVGGNNGGTFVKWDCQGYKEMQIDGFLTVKSSLIEKAEGGGPVKAAFLFSNAKAWGDMLGEVSMDPFNVKGMKGLKLTFTKVVLDFSDTRNAQGMAFPANHDGGTGDDWRGLYFKEMKALLPKYLKRDGKQVEIAMKDVLIGKLGVTGAVSVTPVFAVGNGNLGGWGFSMDKFELALMNNSLTKGAFSGKLKLPIAKTELGYSCLLAGSQNGLQTLFEVQNAGDIDVDMWGAKLSIADGSKVSVTSVNDDVTVKAVLSGALTIDKQFADLKNVSVHIPDVEFQGFTIQNKAPYVSATLFKFASPQKTFAGFPVSIDPGDGIEAKFEEGGKKAGLKLGFHVGLDGNEKSAISGGTKFTIWGKMAESEGKQTWTPDKPQLDEISIKADVAACSMEGKINLYSGDQKFGDGFRGAITVEVRPLVKIASTVQFGATKYNSAQTYRYWYVDGMAVMGVGIPVFPGFGIYGFGGGAYYHMKPVKAIPAAKDLEGNPEAVSNFQQDAAGATSTGVSYDPDAKVKFGLKATIVMGTMPKPNAFNGDVTIEASFFEGGGLNEIALSGNGYFVTPPDPKSRPAKDKALVYAGVDFRYSTAKKSFDGLLDVAINLKAGNTKLITGGGQASMHFSKDKWFIKIGEPNNRIGLTVLDLLDVNSYLMVGKNSLPGMPPLPTSPINFQQKLPSFNQSNKRKAEVGTGSGFALGQQLDVNTGKMKFLIFYAQIAISFGYDISILQSDQTCQYAVGGKKGMNGWYAEGQVYAGLDASVGLDINLWFLKAQVELFQVGVYAALEAGLPNPTWLKGEVKGEYSVLNGLLHGSCNFKFKYGNRCDETSGDPFAGVKVIAEMKPEGGDADVFSYPEVVYNLPLNHAMSIEHLDGDGDVVVETFRFGLNRMEVVNLKQKKAVAGSSDMVHDGMATLFSPDEMFDAKTNHRIRVEVSGERKVKGKWEKIMSNKDPNKVHLERDSADFTTGDAPENFPNSNVIATLPGRMQRFYYYREESTGYIAFNQYPGNVEHLKPEEKGYHYDYIARVQQIGAGSQVVEESPLAWEPGKKRVSFKLPSGSMKPSAIYIVQIVRKKVPEKGTKKPDGGVETKDVAKNLGDGQTINVRQRRLNAIRLGGDEFMVYQLAFKTSKFERFNTKINDYKKKDPVVTTGAGDYKGTITATYTGSEPFDWYDFHQTPYQQGSVTKYVLPHLRAYAVNNVGLKNKYYWTELDSRYFFYVNDAVLREKMKADPSNQGVDNIHNYRTYPAAGAYGYGSRLTHGSSISDSTFPKWTVGLAFAGNATAGKLTNDEINASYWKGYDDPDDGTMMTLIDLDGGPGPGAGMQAGKGLKGVDPISKLIIRYDLPTVLRNDRKQVYEALRYWASLNGHAANLNGKYLGFMKYNKPPTKSNPNPDYYDMELSKNSPYSVDVEFGYGNSPGRNFEIHLP